jgi:lysophospholipase L1-like esterase
VFGSTRSSREGKPSAAGSLHAGNHKSRSATKHHPIRTFVALGDSFTEGLNDEPRFDGRHRGWADRVADGLLLRQDIDELAYANLAIRGRLIHQVRTEQVPAAVAMQPDLVTFAAGVNDALRRNFDVNVVATDLEDSIKAVRETGARVLIFAYGDPARRSRALSRLTERMRVLRTATVEIARLYDCYLVDFWGVSTYDDERLWSSDRLHLSPLGHRVTAAAVLDALGLGDPRWRSPVSTPQRIGFAHRRVLDVAWLGAHAGPWFTRRLRGVSSGAGVEPKDPVYRVVR